MERKHRTPKLASSVLDYNILVSKCSWTHTSLSRSKKGIVTPWDRQVLKPHRLGTSLSNETLGPATVASPFMELTVTDTLRDLSAGATAIIDHVAGNHSYSTRLQSMGFQSGQSIRVLRRTAHVMHVRVGSTEWAIRDQNAELVKIIPREQSR